MNYKIVRLLFDPRDPIGKKEFRSGIIVLFILACLSLQELLLPLVYNLLISDKGPEMLGKYSILLPIHIPTFPFAFVIFYSSIVLAVKRVKDTGGPLWRGVLFGFCVFLFFNGLFLSLRSNLAMSNMMGIEISDKVRIFHLSVSSLGVSLGLIALIYLSVTNGYKLPEKDGRKKSTLTIYQFIAQLGLLYLVVITLTALILISHQYFKHNALINYIPIAIGLLLLAWYITLVIKRLRNAHKPFYPFLLSVTVYISTLSFALSAHLKTDDLNVISISLTVFSLGNFLFAIANALLFLLEEKSAHTNPCFKEAIAKHQTV